MLLISYTISSMYYTVYKAIVSTVNYLCIPIYGYHIQFICGLNDYEENPMFIIYMGFLILIT